MFPKSGKPDEFAAVVNASLRVYRDEYPDATEERLVGIYCQSWEAFDKAFGGASRKQVFAKHINEEKTIYR